MPVFEITAPDGRTFEVEGPDARGALAALTKALGASAAPAPQEKVGFGERGQREQDMPLTADAQHELDVTKRMARERDMTSGGFNRALTNGMTFGFADEAKALGSAIGGALTGNNPVQTYKDTMEAERRLREEYEAQHPGKAMAGQAAGILLGAGMATPASAASTLGGLAKEGAKVAGLQGAIQGFGEGEGVDRLTGAATGGAIGGVVGAAAPVVVAGAKAIAQPLVNTVRSAINPEKEAARRIAASHTKDLTAGKAMDDAAYDAARSSGQPVTLMDRGGENTTALARSAANQSADARQVMDDVIRPRFATQVERLDDVLKGESKLGMSADDFMEAADLAARKANGPAYRKAMALGDGDVWDSTLERLASSPAMQSAIKKAIEKSADNAILDGFGAMNPRIGVDEAGNLIFKGKGGLPAYPDLRLWDLTKRELDRMAKMAERSSDSDARIYKGLAKQLVDHLDSLGEMGKAYKAARQTAASFFGAQNAFEAGMKYATAKGMSARDAMRGLAKLKPEERKLFSEGYIQAQRDMLAELKSNRDATMSLMDSKGAIERARVALGKDGAKRLQAQLEVERAMDAVRKAMGNSTTARQLTELGLASAAGSGIAGATGGADPTNLTVGAIAGAATKFGKGKLNERLSAQIGKMLASGNPKQVEALVKAASKSPQYLQAVRGITRALASAGAMGGTTMATSP